MCVTGHIGALLKEGRVMVAWTTMLGLGAETLGAHRDSLTAPILLCPAEAQRSREAGLQYSASLSFLHYC